MKTRACLVASLALAMTAAVAEGALVPGDLAFTSFNADGDDGWAIVALTDVAAGEQVYFRDDEWDGTAFGNGESESLWTTPAIVAGTVFFFDDADGPSPTITATGGAATGSWADTPLDGTDSGPGDSGISTGGETIFMFQGSSNTPSNFIGAFSSTEGIEDSLSSTGLTLGSTAIAMTGKSGNPDVAVYIGPRSGKVSFAEYLPLLGDPANWETADGSGDQSGSYLPFDTTAFTIIPEPSALSLIAIAGLLSYRRSRVQRTSALSYYPAAAGGALRPLSLSNKRSSEPASMKSLTGVLAIALLALMASPAAAVVRINEIMINAPDGSDKGREYFELVSTSGMEPLDGLSLVAIRGLVNNDPGDDDYEKDHGREGEIEDVVRLDGWTTGANGLFLSREYNETIGDLLPLYDPATMVDDHEEDDFDFENDTVTFLLVRDLQEGITGSSGLDLDSDNDGILESTPWASILDGIAVQEKTGTGIEYATQFMLPTFPVFLPSGLNFTPDTVFRESTTREWFAADVFGPVSEDPAGPNEISPVEFADLHGVTPDYSNDFDFIDGILPSTPGGKNIKFVGPAPLFGDYNDDGKVDAADYAVLRNNFGEDGSALFNRDPLLDDLTVGVEDYNLWRWAYGNSNAELANVANATAPEPTSAAMMLGAAALFLGRRKQPKPAL